MMSDIHPLITADVDSIDAANTDFDCFSFNHDAYVDAPVLMRDIGRSSSAVCGQLDRQ
jgi:hypothetical protein